MTYGGGVVICSQSLDIRLWPGQGVVNWSLVRAAPSPDCSGRRQFPASHGHIVSGVVFNKLGGVSVGLSRIAGIENAQASFLFHHAIPCYWSISLFTALMVYLPDIHITVSCYIAGVTH